MNSSLGDTGTRDLLVREVKKGLSCHHQVCPGRFTLHRLGSQLTHCSRKGLPLLPPTEELGGVAKGWGGEGSGTGLGAPEHVTCQRPVAEGTARAPMVRLWLVRELWRYSCAGRGLRVPGAATLETSQLQLLGPPWGHHRVSPAAAFPRAGGSGVLGAGRPHGINSTPPVANVPDAEPPRGLAPIAGPGPPPPSPAGLQRPGPRLEQLAGGRGGSPSSSRF